ncbi:unnamed protein product [Cyclocybe aegerita]|uniref:Uncharacterized protein n=1 Tax=Cyclocybe aegerita TaxID=1973307 RepID=A0A8S0VT38_CYCAE|nr:unnamed protein product [Cyclocybe aegerita]
MSMYPMPHQSLPNAYPQPPPADNHIYVDDDGEDDDTPDGGHYKNHFQPSYNPTHQHVVSYYRRPCPACRTTPTTGLPAAIGLLQETKPKMENLSRFLNSVNAENVVLDDDLYRAILQGMDSAALLERQLSRMISPTHKHYRRS